MGCPLQKSIRILPQPCRRGVGKLCACPCFGVRSDVKLHVVGRITIEVLQSDDGEFGQYSEGHDAPGSLLSDAEVFYSLGIEPIRTRHDSRVLVTIEAIRFDLIQCDAENQVEISIMLELFGGMSEEALGRVLKQRLWLCVECIRRVEGVLSADFEEEVVFAFLALRHG